MSDEIPAGFFYGLGGLRQLARSLEQEPSEQENYRLAEAAYAAGQLTNKRYLAWFLGEKERREARGKKEREQ
jgi:hypothetical protein